MEASAPGSAWNGMKNESRAKETPGHDMVVTVMSSQDFVDLTRVMKGIKVDTDNQTSGKTHAFSLLSKTLRRLLEEQTCLHGTCSICTQHNIRH